MTSLVHNPLAVNERQSRVDWLMLGALGGLMVIGVFFVFSATTVAESNTQLAWHKQAWFRQIVWYALGLAGMAAVSSVDYRLLARWSLVGYVAIILTLITVLIPGVGAEKFGARRWIDLRFFQFQASEFAKLAFI